MNTTKHKHSLPFQEGCQPKVDGAETKREQNETNASAPKKSNRTKGSTYSEILKINDTFIQAFPVFSLPKNVELAQRARDLRQARNLPEVLFWMQVTKGRFHQIDFDRQTVIGNYIVDFYVKRLRLIIEIDGSSHIGKEVYDRKRQEHLEELGLRFYRISTYDIKYRLGFVMKELEEFIVENYGEKGD